MAGVVEMKKPSAGIGFKLNVNEMAFNPGVAALTPSAAEILSWPSSWLKCCGSTTMNIMKQMYLLLWLSNDCRLYGCAVSRLAD